ncbi:hypothetical protein [Flavivirga eckloniae]|uniref:DUF2975 domain-containing protein n=1 Tax=Flavivirga eckloniae TaxID=1803846 RepID=A0A2K9PQ28_9FLAO|nr:hypothetical protein [Flavivirga eckloniae]AUP79171.1 hypothetical protein C1H87_10840 [Flavivirga eckloniae]
MKRIKLLYRFLIFINVFFSILLVVQLVLLIGPDLIYWKQYEDRTFGTFQSLIEGVRLVLLLIGLFKVQHGVRAIIDEGFYNVTSQVKFKKSGFFLIIYVLISFAYNILVMKELELNIFIVNFIQYYFILLVGIGLYIFSDFIKNGGKLKQENDLTI